jgi:hypothetical protein
MFPVGQTRLAGAFAAPIGNMPRTVKTTWDTWRVPSSATGSGPIRAPKDPSSVQEARMEMFARLGFMA